MSDMMRRGGFTFVELLIAMAIGVIVMGVLMVTFFISRSSYLSADASIRVQEEVRRAYDKMTKELRKAGNVNGPGGVTNTNMARLDFEIARSYDTNAPPAGCGGICWGNDNGNGWWVHYLTNANTLYRCQSTAKDTAIIDYSTRCGGGVQPCCDALALNVQNFSADYDDSKRTVTMRLETKVTSNQLAGGSMGVTPAPLIASVELRNDS